jgi:predicted membrane protein
LRFAQAVDSMIRFRRLDAKEVALSSCFAALYVVLSFVPMFHLLGAFQYITLAAMLVPLIGIMLGPYLGAVSTLLGGIINYSINTFSPMSLVAGVIGAACAGLLYKNRQALCSLIYLILLFTFALYPLYGPFWTSPEVMWFHLVGFLILISPLQSIASKSFRSGKVSKLLFAFFLTSLTSTLAGQIAGNVVFETITDPRGIWPLLTFVYPFERTTIAVVAAFIGVPLFEALKSINLTSVTRVGLGKMEHEKT